MAQAGGGTKPKPYVPPEEETYAPVEPGMYDPVYGAPQPNYPATLPPLKPEGDSPPPEVGPGMYPPAPQVYGAMEPGIYAPAYTKPGEYAPRAPSATYGGPVWPPYHDGANHPVRQAPPWKNPGINVVETLYPASGAPSTTRLVPSGGTVVQPGPSRLTEGQIPSGAQSRGDILGAMGGSAQSAPPRSLATVGPTASQLGYRLTQGDPGVAINDVGSPILTDDVLRQADKQRAKSSAEYARPLGGLFGGIDPNVTKGLQGLAPGTLRAHMLKKWKP